MKSEELMCPLLKEPCMGDRCAWFTPMGQCSILIIGRNMSMDRC